MSTTRYKLTYFDLRGIAETARLIFAFAGVPYEDCRIVHHRIDRAPFEALKPQLPFGKLPILEFDGLKICQSNAISRHLANEHGLGGKTPAEKVRCDMLVDCFLDVAIPTTTIAVEPDENKKKELLRQYTEEKYPNFLAMLEKLLIENNGGDGYFVGDSLTWTDLAFVVDFDLVSFIVGDHLAKYPKLSALKKRVEGLPKIAEWIAKRPVTMY